MLREHLSQRHDRASNRFEKIDVQVTWVHEHILERKPAKVLDLGCGPGLYTSRLARLGHECVGIDYSPSSVDYAVEFALQEKLACKYQLEDIRLADYGGGFGLVMLLQGEFNTFRPADARSILQKACEALADGGALLLEAHTFDGVRGSVMRPTVWFSVERGLFSDAPHLWLQEHSWDEETKTATTRYFIIDAATAHVTAYGGTAQAYSEDEYSSLLRDCGFGEVEFPSLAGTVDKEHADKFAILARKRA